jgi:hypothetical protein
MNQRLPLAISATALAVALVGSTPLGQAAGSVLDKVVPRAKRADFAANAAKLNGHRSSFNPKPGQIPIVDAEGKLPASIGAVGPPGPPGATGAQGQQGPPGPRGVSGYQRVQDGITVPGEGVTAIDVRCPGGRSVLGAGYKFGDKDFAQALFVIESYAVSDSEWHFRITNETGGNKAMTLYAVCANAS